MTEKVGIIADLGEAGLLLPAKVNTALLANDRIKYFFTLLQTAIDQAGHPGRECPSLRTEREMAGIEDPVFDEVVAGTRPAGEDFLIPHLEEILSAISDCTTEMAAPFEERDDTSPSFADRWHSLNVRMPEKDATVISAAAIAAITTGDRARGDSLHLLVMDMHAALNRLQGELARETIDGARAYMLGPDDHEYVRAFMAGLNRTAPLKFGHPGLGTTATRAGNRLLIQNDIGVTDAHILVVTVENSVVSIIYTDIHLQRLEFFMGLFDGRGVAWQDTVSRYGHGEAGRYHLLAGRYAAADQAALLAFLSFLGSRIVFLIDWNRARKQLRTFLLNKDSVAILRWAADHDIGHRGFLQLGGETIIFSALELAAKVPLRYGEPLYQLLGREQTIAFFQWVLKTSAEGLLAGRSTLLVRDEIRTELLHFFRSAHEEMIELTVEHASMLIEVGTLVREMLFTLRQTGHDGVSSRSAKLAKEWESSADEIVLRLRNLSRRSAEADFFFSLIHTADDALDYLEEAAFVVTLLPATLGSGTVTAHLSGLADIAVRAGQGYLRVLVSAQKLHQAFSREEMQDFLAAVDNVISLEHECDEALRITHAIMYAECTTFQQLTACLEAARLIEESTNSLMASAFLLHDKQIEEVNR